MRQMVIWVRTQLIALHKYPTAPDDVSYLRDLHRHTFNIEVGLCVNPELDRELEFIQMKKIVDSWKTTLDNDELFEYPVVNSCESICKALHEYLNNKCLTVTYIKVDEDGEMGCTLAL